MRQEFLPFSRPSIGEAETEAVLDVLRSGWITSGPRLVEFEEAFAERVGVAGAMAVTSATAGFHVLFEVLDIGPGEEVIMPSLTWPSPAIMLHHQGARPVFVDIDIHSLQIDPSCVEGAISPRTRAIMPVHFAGQPADLDRLRTMCDRHGLLLIEDAAHAVGTEYRGETIGARGNPAVFSFHAIKNITTGEGGMVTTADVTLLENMRRCRFHGIDRDAWKRYGREVTEEEKRDYDLITPGWKYTMTDMQAALGLVQLGRLDSMLARREALAARYDELLEEIPEVIRPQRVQYPSRHAWHLYTVRVERERAGLTRDEFRRALRQRNIGTGLHFLAVHELDFFRRHYPTGRLEHTERVAESIVSLPLFPEMTEDDVDDVVTAIREVIATAQ